MNKLEIFLRDVRNGEYPKGITAHELALEKYNKVSNHDTRNKAHQLLREVKEKTLIEYEPFDSNGLKRGKYGVYSILKGDGIDERAGKQMTKWGNNIRITVDRVKVYTDIRGQQLKKKLLPKTEKPYLLSAKLITDLNTEEDNEN